MLSRWSTLAAIASIQLCLVGCGDTSAAGGGGAGAGNGGTSTGAAPEGGGGQNAFTSCDDCAAPNDICVDAASCASACPSPRVACDGDSLTGNDDPWQICCAAGDVCCAGANNSTFCSPGDQPCPNVCPDGTTCSSTALCQLDPFTNTYSCQEDCPAFLVCNDVCCPVGSKCEAGTCPLPDLWVDQDYLSATVETVVRDVSENSCSLMEGCIDAPGTRKLLRFSTRTPNTGDGDLYLGSPANNPSFVYSQCHDHYHFQGYAEYRLLDEDGNQTAVGHKQAFCLEDFDPYDPNAPSSLYDCGNQGIQLGWSDIYDRGLPCQWIDITDVPPGNYQLRSR